MGLYEKISADEMVSVEKRFSIKYSIQDPSLTKDSEKFLRKMGTCVSMNPDSHRIFGAEIAISPPLQRLT